MTPSSARRWRSVGQADSGAAAVAPGGWMGGARAGLTLPATLALLA